MNNLYKLIRPCIFKIDPEIAHGITIKTMKTGLVRSCYLPIEDTALRQNVFGLDFENPVGMAAGFDKNAEIIVPVLKLGFGFTEVGTVTPKPQGGNPRPRIFRDPSNEAVINRMGFPNGGVRVFKPNLDKAKSNPACPDGSIIGVNIGMNKGQTIPAEDYIELIKELSDQADYITINISSPNTPGLRDLQEKNALSELLSKVMKTIRRVGGDYPTPLLVKLAPDLNEKQQEGIAKTLIENGVSGVILSNTTLDRPDFLNKKFGEEKGGLSGAPLRDKSTDTIRRFYKLTRGKLPIIGVGGISTARHAYDKIRAGASLVQIYTGMIYEGPDIANNINKGLLDLLDHDGFSNISQAIGADHK